MATNISGIPQTSELIFQDRSLFLYGENGTGKSSYVRALEWLIQGQTRGFPPKSGPGYDRRIRNKDHESEPSEVLVELKDGSIIKRIDDQPVILTGPSANTWLTRAQELDAILRRRELLGFVGAPPGERYKIVEKWIGLGDVHKVFLRIKDAQKHAKESQQKAKSELDQLETGLRTTFSLPSTPATFAATVQAMRVRLEALGLSVPTDVVHASSVLVEARRRAPPPIPTNLLPTLAVLKVWRTGAPTALHPLAKSYSEARDAHQAAKDALIAHATELLSVIDAAQVYLDSADTKECPVCERNIERDAMRARLDERRAVFTALEAARKAEQAALLALQKEINMAKGAWGSKAYCGDAVHAATYAVVREDALNALTALLGGTVPAEWSHNTTIETLEADLTARRDEAQEKSNTELNTAIRQLESASAWNKIEAARKTARDADTALARANELFSAAQDARHAMFNHRLKEVTEPIKEFYKSIHPNEDIDNIELKLPPPTDAGMKDKQAELIFSFSGQSATHPMIHLSEGHLDTLGLAFFLMNLHRTVKETGGEPPLLILDDVISSVDATHRTRIANEILRRFKDWQVFITTHDRIWYKRLCHLSNNHGVQPERRTIRRWTRERGPQHQAYHELRADLQRRLDIDDAPHAIVATAGIMLEEILNEVRQHYGLSIRAKPDDRYTLNDLYRPVASLLRKTSNQGILPGWHAAHATVLEELDTLLSDPSIRNVVGAHYNAMGDEIPEAEAERFARAAMGLHDAFYCKTCGTLVLPLVIGEPDARCDKGCTEYERPAPEPAPAPTAPPA